MALAGAAFVAPVALRSAPASPAYAEAPVTSGSLQAAPPSASTGQSSTQTLACCALVAGVAASRRSTLTRRKFFAAPSPAPKKPESYKDIDDPWLGAADLGFDPLNLAVGTGVFDRAPSAVPETTYYNYRESEVKHGRFAMTAFLAIFAESADRQAVLKQLGVAGAVDNLDGTLGLDEVQAPVLFLGLGYQALAEYNLQKDEDDGNILSVEYQKDRCPGDLGFDPLGFGKVGEQQFIGFHNYEVNAGRLAMVGVTSFLIQEFVAKDL